ncbi:hypothetical protein G7Z17_g13096 [Cylindrodendrum hubeiense]|uniref:Major facilitator superfamily (MFS) profile domain-containing protein n=1 Tax=Cylindrodendrum hubeiense TaxID=595255 RepID=A0A9P5GSV0_9HYPO|nr:hypothetical protein G7Z17_g13096 [Cylindrodendrum hubeiense]
MAADLDDKVLSSTVEHREDDSHNESVQPGTTDVENLNSSDFTWSFNILANLFALYMIILTSSWSTIVPATAIAFIAARFPEDASNAAWIATSSALSSAVAAAFIGNMSDIFDRRSFLLFGCVLGCIGMLIGGRANSLSMVIGGQVLNGLGVGCGFLSNPLIQEIVPKNHRALATAFATIFGAGSFIGAPIIEGVFIQRGIGGALEGWRIGFYVGAGLNLLTLISILLFYHPMPRPNPEGYSAKQRLLKLDWLGIFLACAGLTLFLVGINYGGNPYEWTSAIVLGTMIPGAVLLAIFGLWEWKGTSTGILPHAVFQDRNYNAALLIRVSGGFALYGCQAFLPQVVVHVFGTDGLMTAVWQLPMSVSTIMGALVAAIILRYFKEIRWIVVGLLTILLIGACLMVLVKPGVNFAVWFFPSMLMGLAIGAEASLITILSGLAAPNESIATAVCIGVAAGFIGGAIATTMYSQIFNAKIKEILPGAISKAAIAAGLPESRLADLLSTYATKGIQALPTVQGVTSEVVQAVTEASRSAYAKSFTYIWYTLVVFCVVSAMGCWFFTSTTKYFTDEIAAPVMDRSNKNIQPNEKNERI